MEWMWELKLDWSVELLSYSNLFSLAIQVPIHWGCRPLETWFHEKINQSSFLHLLIYFSSGTRCRRSTQWAWSKINSLDRPHVHHRANAGRQTITHTHIHTYEQFQGCLFIHGRTVNRNSRRNSEQQENAQTPSTAGARNRPPRCEAAAIITGLRGCPLRTILNVDWLCRGQAKIKHMMESVHFCLCWRGVYWPLMPFCNKICSNAHLKNQSVQFRLIYDWFSFSFPSFISPLTCNRTPWLWIFLPITAAFSDFLWE